MPKLFGFAQLDFAGALPLADGRYLQRADGEERVLVTRTLGSPPQPHRRRRRAKGVEPEPAAAALPLSRVTAIRAFAPFADEEEARRWLEQASEAEETADEIVADAIALLNQALHAQWVAAAEPHSAELTPERAVAVRIGFGAGEEVAEGRFSEAREVDVWATGASRRRRREEGMQPQERVAAVLGGRERFGVCETLLLRARADLDAGRRREAALQLRIGLEALLAELGETNGGEDHAADLATLGENRREAGEAANQALAGELSPERLAQVEELLALCERVLRRRRLLRG
ncbi:MAG: hypothetical protein AB7V58_16830 [Solirubrobacterales bacterium]